MLAVSGQCFGQFSPDRLSQPRKIFVVTGTGHLAPVWTDAGLASDIDRKLLFQRNQKNAVVIHGFLDAPSSACMTGLIEALRGLCYNVLVYQYPSGEPIEDNAQWLFTSLSGLLQGSDVKFDLVAHSEGGLVARAATEPNSALNGRRAFGGAVENLVTIATPHNGVEAAALGVFVGLRAASMEQMVPGSQFLQNLNSAPAATGTRYFTIAGQVDPGRATQLCGQDTMCDGLVAVTSAHAVGVGINKIDAKTFNLYHADILGTPAMPCDQQVYEQIRKFIYGSEVERLCFPVHFPTDAGTVYTYRDQYTDGGSSTGQLTVGRPITVAGISVPVVPFWSSPVSADYYTSDSVDGWQSYGYDDAACAGRGNPPLRIPSGMRKGDVLPFTGRSVLTDKNPKDIVTCVSGTDSVTITFAGREGVTVPAGTFPNAAKVVIDGKEVDDDGETSKIASVLYLAPSVGIVKMALPGDTGEIGCTTELVSVRLPKWESDTRPAPAFTAPAVTNGASFLSGLTAGSIVTIFGTNLSSSIKGVVQADRLPLPTELSGTSVTMNGRLAPLFAIANVNNQEQINVQAPNEIGNTSVATLVVYNNGQPSDPVAISVSPAQPGIFTTDGTRGIITHANGVLVSQTSPAERNEVVVIYATGLGPVSPTPTTGAAASASPLSVSVTKPAVRVGGVSAEVLWSGLAPGYVGLHQVNARVPSNVASGEVDVVIDAAGFLSKTVKMSVK